MGAYPQSIKEAIKGLTAIQTRMALILLKINGAESALEFIRNVKGQKVYEE